MLKDKIYIVTFAKQKLVISIFLSVDRKLKQKSLYLIFYYTNKVPLLY